MFFGISYMHTHPHCTHTCTCNNHLHTHTHTNTAAVDYQGTIQALTFINASTQSVPVSIFVDQLLEDTESFLARLSSSDDFVQLGLQPATVLIQDDNGTFSDVI